MVQLHQPRRGFPGRGQRVISCQLRRANEDHSHSFLLNLLGGIAGRRTTSSMAESLSEFFLQHFRAHGHDCAYRQRRGYRTESFTYADVLALAFGFASTLETRGIGKGDRIMLWGENCAEWVAAFFGCALTGVIVVPMDDGASPDFAMRVIQQVQAKLLIASLRHINDLAGAVPALTFEDLSTARSDSPTSMPGPSREDTLQIVFTSGTTAEPRGVVISHANVLANVAPLERAMQGYLKYERFVHPLRFLNLLPLSHVFGQFLGMFLPPLLGGTVIFQDELKPSEVINTIHRERVSVLVSVPRVLQSLKHKIELDLEQSGKAESFRRRFVAAKEKHFLHRWWIFRSIRRQFGWKFLAMISGGAALDSETEEFWGRLGYAAIQGYGLTETTSLVSVNHPFKLGKGSIGKVLPGREVKLAEDGEILVRGAGVTSGYWNDTKQGGASEARASNNQINDDQGWYRTGDVGALDADGNLYFKGRKKEVIVTPAGLNIYPEDLEAALRQQPEVKDCIVVGIERDGNAEPCAVVILRDSGPAAKKLDEAMRRANQLLAEYQQMRMWMEWPEEDFPRTSTQKPRRSLITEAARARFAEKSPLLAQSARGKWGTAAPDEASTRQHGPLADLIARVSGHSVTNLREDASLDSDLGLSSLDRVDLLSAIEDRYQVDLSETRFSAVRTVGDLERMLRGEAAPVAGYHYPRWVLRWPVTWLRWLAHYLLMRPAIILLGWPRIEGREHLRDVNGPLLVISNHLGDVDPGFILTALPARFRNHLAVATGGEALEALRIPPPGRNVFLRAFDRLQWTLGVSLLNLFPLPREAGFRRSFAYAGEAVDRGYNILVFPEGRHTTDGKMNPFRAGIGLLAVNLGIPVLPMRIDGLYEAKAAGRWIVAPWTICVKIGKPTQFEPGTDPGQIAAELQKAVENL
jgi:long-chain acyl-CoA synthetase